MDSLREIAIINHHRYSFPLKLEFNIPKILATHTIQHEVDAEIREEQLLGNVLRDYRWL